MINLGLANEWVADAHRTLMIAQQICSDAELKLSSLDRLVNHQLPRRIAYIGNIFSATKEHQKRCSKVVELCRKGIDIEKIDTHKKDALNLIIRQLRATKVPDFVVQGGHGHLPAEREFNLAEFISTDSIDALVLNIEDYELKFENISELVRSEFEHLIEEPFGTCTKKYARLLKLYNDVMYEVNNNSSTNGVLKQIIKENHALEGELASMLHLITNHYDQCKQGQAIVAAGGRRLSNEVTVDFDILQNDVLELPEVTKDLQNINDIILHNNAKAQDIIQTRLGLIDGLETEIEHQIEYYKEFKDHNIIKFATLLSKGQHLLSNTSNSSVVDNLEAAEQLTVHYKTFSNVYTNKFFTELYYEKYVYPRLFLSKLTKFLNEELAAVLKQERERRTKWLEKYGDYIPKELKLPGEEMPGIVQIITEGLDEMQEEPGIERRILDLMAK